MPCFLGIDVGTSSLKTLAVNERGTVLAAASAPYNIICPKNGYSEQDPDTWWAAFIENLAKIRIQLDGDLSRIDCIGFSGQMHGTVTLDKDLRPLRPAIIHCDARTGTEVRELNEMLGEDIKKILMNPVGSGIMLPSLVWLKKNEPQLFEKIRYVLLPKDYVRFRLTGEIMTDYSDASATLLFDLKQGCWAHGILKKTGIPGDIFPRYGDSADSAGYVSKSGSAETGLKEGAKVILGGADQIMQSIGSGSIRPGQATVNIGSGGQVCIQTKQPFESVHLGLNTFNGFSHDRWYVMGATTSSGSSLKWLNGILQQDDYEEMNAEVEKIRPGSDGLIFLPYLSGERCPRLNPDISGVFWGLSYRTDRGRMTRAVMEGVTFALRSCLDTCRASGMKVRSLIANGGGSRSRPWLQMQADIFQVPLKITVQKEQAVFGAAISAAVGYGYFKSFEEACAQMVRYQAVQIEPNPVSSQIYEEYYQLYLNLYDSGQKNLEAVTRMGRRS